MASIKQQLKSELKGVADAVRGVTGEEELMTIPEIAEEIRGFDDAYADKDATAAALTALDEADDLLAQRITALDDANGLLGQRIDVLTTVESDDKAELVAADDALNQRIVALAGVHAADKQALEDSVSKLEFDTSTRFVEYYTMTEADARYYDKEHVDSVISALQGVDDAFTANYPTKEEMAKAVADLEAADDERYTKTEADSKFLTEHQPLPDVYTKAESDGRYLQEHQSLASYYTKSEADGKFLTSHQSLSDYYKKTDVYSKSEIDGKKFLTSHQSLASYYTKSEADGKFLTSHQSLGNYYTKTEADGKFLTSHQSLASYYNKSEVDALIAALEGDVATFADWDTLAGAVANGLGAQVLPVGTQLTVPWTITNGTATYDMLWNPVHHGTADLETGATVKVAYLQMHHCLPFETQFSQYQAFVFAATAIPAGTYNVKMGASWGSNVVNGKSYQFTLTKPVPARGQLTGFYRGPDVAPSTWRVYSYESQTSTTPIETCVVTEGSGGTNLGTFTFAGASVPTDVPGMLPTQIGNGIEIYGLNSMQRTMYGNGRYKDSAIRQYLNATGSDWWKPANIYDRPPDYRSHKGFLSGFDEEFVDAMLPIEVVTAKDYVGDSSTTTDPDTDVTYDKVFLPSWEQHYLAVSQYFGGKAGLEGEAWSYWKAVAGTKSPLAASTWGNAATYHPEYCQTDMLAKTTPRGVWLRSAYRSHRNYAGFVYSSGYCYGTYAIHGYRAAAACAIGKSLK